MKIYKYDDVDDFFEVIDDDGEEEGCLDEFEEYIEQSTETTEQHSTSESVERIEQLKQKEIKG